MGSDERNSAGPVLVIDGETVALAHGPGDMRPADPAADRAAIETAACAVLLNLTGLRTQMTARSNLAAEALTALPFLAAVDTFDAASREAALAALTPVDRLVRAEAPAAGASLVDLVTTDVTARALVAAAFEAMSGDAFAPVALDGPGGAAEPQRISRSLAEKWRFLPLKHDIVARLARIAGSRGATGQALRVAHYRCADAALSLAVSPHHRYLGLDDMAPEESPSRTSFPARAYRSITALTGADDLRREADVILLTGVSMDAGQDELAETLAPLAGLAAQRCTIIAITDMPDLGARRDGAAFGRATRLLGRALSRECEVRSFATIAHKPFDAVPQRVVLELEGTA